MKRFIILSAVAVLAVNGAALAGPKPGFKTQNIGVGIKPLQTPAHFAKPLTFQTQKPAVKVLPQITGATFQPKTLAFAGPQTFHLNHHQHLGFHKPHAHFGFSYPIWGYNWYSPWYSWGHVPYLPFGW